MGKVKKPLRHTDIVVGKTYKVVAKPSHWGPRERYPNLGKVGVARWVNAGHGVGLLIDNCIDRIVPPECLIEWLTETKKEKEKTMGLTAAEVKVGSLYKVIQIPKFWEKVAAGNYPVLDKVGKLVDIKGEGGLLLFGITEEQHFVPFSCLEKYCSNPTPEVPDDLLIDRMLENPEGVLKIVKGLAKMNKDMRLRAFVERGTLV